MTIGFIASSGGHLEELTKLYPLTKEYESFLVTEQTGETRTAWGERTYFVKQINRKESGFIIHFIRLFSQARKIIKKEKPSCIISTGALISYPFCIIAKVHKIKIIFIESFARVNQPSLTGKLVYPISDLFLIQWKELERFYPKSVYKGGIF